MYNERSAFWYGLGAVACWSTVATAFKIALAELDPLQMLFVACCCSSVFLLSVLAWQGKLKLPLDYLREAPLFYLGMALINPLFYYLVLFEAYDLLPAQQAMAINYSWALTLAVLAIPLLGQRPRIKDFVAAAIAYFGIIVIATQGALTELQFEQPLGTGLALLSTVIWALYWIFNTRNQIGRAHV